jgi:hypothetical protein
MSAEKPLVGLELIDCAKANAEQGVEVAAQLCGYGSQISEFQQQLHQACQQIGVQIEGLQDLITPQQMVLQQGGIEVAPETESEL